MRQVYSAASPPEAHMLRGYLETAGIRAVVLGEHGYAARGGLPIDATTAPAIWVAEEEAEQALALIQEFFAQQPLEHGENWRCPNCGESLEAQFTACWNCGAERIENRE
jgi:hypothetical protein